METRKFKLEKSFKKVLNESEINRYEVFHPYEGFEADVGFWYGEYCRDVDAGLNNPWELQNISQKKLMKNIQQKVLSNLKA